MRAADLRFGDAAGPAQRFHQSVHLPGGDATGVGLHHHGVERLVDPAASFQPAGEEAALPQFWDGQGEVAHLADEQPLPVAVAMGGALIGAALIKLGAGGAETSASSRSWKPRRTISGIRAPAVVPSMS